MKEKQSKYAIFAKSTTRQTMSFNGISQMKSSSLLLTKNKSHMVGKGYNKLAGDRTPLFKKADR